MNRGKRTEQQVTETVPAQTSWEHVDLLYLISNLPASIVLDTPPNPRKKKAASGYIM